MRLALKPNAWFALPKRSYGSVPMVVVVNVPSPSGVETVVLPTAAGSGVIDGDVTDPLHPLTKTAPKRRIAFKRNIMTLLLLSEKVKLFPLCR